MKRLLLLLSVVMFCCCTNEQRVTATFQSADIGGGGYIPGLIQDPQNTQILYARSDVGGVFKSTDGGVTWSSKNNGITKMFNNSVHSLILDAKEPNTLYRASGELRDYKMVGHIHKSTDGGESWHLLTDKLDYFGNGQTRMCGELLAIDPFDNNTILAGSFSAGLWISRDKGVNWELLGLKGERMSVVKFDPKVRGKIYVSTIGEAPMLEFEGKNAEEIAGQLVANMDFARGVESEILLSIDFGQSFTSIFKSDSVGVHDMAFTNGGKNIVCSTNRGVIIKSEGSEEFRTIDNPILPIDRYQTITASPVDDNIVYTASKFSNKNILNVFVSRDGGVSWDYYSRALNDSNLFEYPTYGNHDAKWLGSSVSMILPDAKDRDKLYLTNWWGVNVTYDGGKNFYGHYFKGLEMTCLEYIQKSPANRDNVLVTICDHGPMIAKEGGKQYHVFPYSGAPSKAFAGSKDDENFIIYSSGDARLRSTTLFTSHDQGSTSKQILHRTGGAFIQCLKEDPFTSGCYWMMMEGEIDNPAEGGGIYKSTDWGESWSRTANPYPSYIKSTPYEEVLINRDILPIIPYQFKNAAGTNQLLAVDGNEPNLLYAGEWTEGIYCSKDGGESWSDISRGLPFHNHRSSVLSFIYCDPSQRGGLYVGFWREGLWYSSDYGDSWEKRYPLDESLFNAVSMAIDGGVMVIASPNSVHSDVDAQLLISFDGGDRWSDIYDNSVGSLNFKAIDLDAERQKIYAATSGQGIFHIDYVVGR